MSGRRCSWLVCGLVSAFWFAATAWLRPLAIPDEGRYVGVAWEMLRSGHWLVPTENGHPFFHKPPLFYWLTAGSMRLLGSNVWAARAASLLAAVTVTTLLFRFVHRWRNNRLPAWTVVSILATLPLFYGSSQYANLDALVAACIGATILMFAHQTLAREAGDASCGARAGAFAAAALGVLAKGAIGVALPVLVLLIWGLVSGRTGRLLRLLVWWPGWLLFLVVAAPWFIAVQLRFPDFAHYFFVVQQFQRFGSAGFNNAQPLWYYPALLVATTLPWSLWMLAALLPRYWSRPDPFDLRKLMWVWLAAVTVFFSLPRSKPIGYILPVLPALAWLIADAIGSVPLAAGLRHGVRGHRTWWEVRGATFALATCLCVTAVVAAHFHQPKSQAALAMQLGAARLPGEPVVFLKNYYFDVPFYARLRSPVIVADAWLMNDVVKDSWRRELIDAERFESSGSSSHLVRYDDLETVLGGKGTAWILGPLGAAKAIPWLAKQQTVVVRGETALWHTSPVAGTNHQPPTP